LLSPRAYCVAAAVAFLIAGSGTASAEVEDIGRPATAFPDGGVVPDPGVFRDGWPSSGDFTSLSVGGKIVSSLGAESGAPPDGQDGGGPLPAPFDYELNADYSSSTLDGGLFPATVTGFGSVDSLIMNDQMLFGDSDHASGFSAFGSGSLGLSNVDPSGDRTGKRGSHCSSDGSYASFICETEEDLGPFMTTSPGAGPDAGYPSGLQSPNPPGANAPFGGAHLSAQQILGLEAIAAQNSFAMTSPWGEIQGTFPPACGDCGVTPLVVDSVFVATSDSGNPIGTPTSDPPPDLTSGGSAANVGGQAAVPEIPPPAMLLIGFAGLALIGSRRRWRSARLG